ncbi:MAG: Polyketide cyclase / dehydrase and lipid transport [Ilumatobacteraceae bacterium]|nr:Polyketide cyclase / dehydrase and lipid transport [Ilumatobacteraceae bacterium]
MARYRMRIRTPWPAVEAFDYLSDLSNFDEWDPGIASAVQVDGDGPGTGAAYELDASGSVFRYVVDVFDRPHRVRAEGRNRWMTSVDSIAVAEDGTGSVVTYDADLRLHGVLRIGDPVLALVFRRIGDRSADGLRQKLQGERI